MKPSSMTLAFSTPRRWLDCIMEATETLCLPPVCQDDQISQSFPSLLQSPLESLVLKSTKGYNLRNTTLSSSRTYLSISAPPVSSRLPRGYSLKQEHNQFIMANGYVPRFMQPPPGMPHPLQRLPFPMAGVNRPNTAPDALFEPPKPAFCPFPDDGPNIFQQAFSSVSKVVVSSLVYFGSIPGAFVHEMGNMDLDMLTVALRENSWSIIIGLVCVVALSVLAWFFSPKGENQTYVHPLASFGNRCIRIGSPLRLGEWLRARGGFERVIAVDELTILCAYRVWRSTLILSIASCYLMWGKPGFSRSLLSSFPLFRRTQAMLSMLFPLQDHKFLYLHHRPLSPSSPPNSQHKLVSPESSTNSVLPSNHIPRAMAPPHPAENERFPKLGRLVRRMN